MRRCPTPWSVGVIIPACNEEATIGACIDSVLSALRKARIDNHWIVVVADSCTDETVKRAEMALGSAGEVAIVELKSAGAARRAGAGKVLARLADIDPSRVWLANTDADTTVSEDWIRIQLRFADEGVAGVAGIVKLAADGCPAAEQIYESTYLTHPQGTHSHVHGANLSVRADAYKDVGGWSTVALAEDHCLWSRLRNRGWRISSPVSSVVTTSARLEGRAKGGFADTLRARVEALNAGA